MDSAPMESQTVGSQKLKVRFCISHKVPDTAAATGPPTTLLVARAADTSLAVLVCIPAFYFLSLPRVPTSHLSAFYFLPFGLQST